MVTGLYADALYKAIQHLREQLQDTVKPYRLIENSVAFGYRFIQPVEVTDADPSAKESADDKTTDDNLPNVLGVRSANIGSRFRELARRPELRRKQLFEAPELG